MCVCITAPGAGLCIAHELESAAPEGLEAASWVTSFPKEQQMCSSGTGSKLLLLEASSANLKPKCNALDRCSLKS